MRLRVGQGQFRAVAGEDAVAEPAGAGLVGAAQDRGMELAEDLRVDLAPGADHGRFGDRDRLRQRHVEGAAVVPQFGQRGDIALTAGCEHEAEDEQHHQQGVEDAAAHLPELVVGGRDGGERADQFLPQAHEGLVGGAARGGGLARRPYSLNSAVSSGPSARCRRSGVSSARRPSIRGSGSLRGVRAIG